MAIFFTKHAKERFIKVIVEAKETGSTRKNLTNLMADIVSQLHNIHKDPECGFSIGGKLEPDVRGHTLEKFNSYMITYKPAQSKNGKKEDILILDLMYSWMAGL